MDVDPGGSECPPAGQFITIQTTEIQDSSMDTDSSINNNSSSNRKRPATSRRICRKCNKKIKKNPNKTKPDINCLCFSDTENKESLNNIQETQGVGIIEKHQGLTNPRVSRLLYTDTDSTPYVVHIQKEISSSNGNCSLHPVEFGRFLKNNNIKNVENGSLKRIGRNRLSLSFSVFSDANNFINNENLKQNNYKVFLPSFQVCRVGLVRGIPADWTEDDILSNVTLPYGCGEILKLRRLKKKSIVNNTAQFVNTESVVFTFDGQSLPKRIFICYNSLPVDLYIYPTIQCYNCCRYGHVKSQCRSTPRCFRCGQGHSGEKCSVDEDSVFCCLCQASHIATSKNCPEFQRQKLIKESMAHKNLSYAEASKLHPPISKLYSTVLTSSSPTSSFVDSQKQNFSSVIKNSAKRTTTESYKKTVFRQPRTPPKSVGGYDKTAHLNLIKDYNPPSGSNGTALPTNSDCNISVPELITAIINYLTQSNILPSSVSPSNVASVSNTILTNSHNGLSDPVELSQCSQQKK